MPTACRISPDDRFFPPPTPARKQIVTQQTLPALQLHIITDLGNGEVGVGVGWDKMSTGGIVSGIQKLTV